MVLKATHDDLGHLGIERTPDLLRSRFFWGKMHVMLSSTSRTVESVSLENPLSSGSTFTSHFKQRTNGPCMH